MRSPVTALGLEIDVSSRYSEFTSDDLDNPNRYEYPISISFSKAATASYHQALPPPARPRRPFYFLSSPRESFRYFRNHLLGINPERQRTGTKYDLGLALGLGADWFPFQRISLSAQTGLDLSYLYDKRRSDRRMWEWSLKTSQTEVAALVYF